MLDRTILVCSAILALTAPGFAQECQSLGANARAALIRKAPTCDLAKEQFGDCAYGASGDAALADIVTEKCEAEFLPKLVRGQFRVYQKAIKRCDDKYENMEGTMYIAMAAGCRIDVAQDYAHKLNRPKIVRSKTTKPKAKPKAKARRPE